MEIDLPESRKYVISEVSRTASVSANPPNLVKGEKKQIVQHFKQLVLMSQ